MLLGLDGFVIMTTVESGMLGALSGSTRSAPFQPWRITPRDGDTRACSSLEPASVGAHSPINDVGALDDSASPITCTLRELAAYSADAELYEARTALLHHWRERVVELLRMRSGDVVLDVGCGTGLRFDLLQQRVGPSGKIVGVRRLASHAGSGPARVADQGWDNVVLIEPLVEDAVLGDRIDHVLFGAVHDVRQSPIKEIEMGCGYGFPAEPRQHFRRTAALPTHRRVTHLPEVRRAGTLMVQVGGAAPSCPGIRR